jgi:predicted RNase H-related nuclease YkuK (DUF458 family)
MGQKKKKRDKDFLKQLKEVSERYYSDKPALNWGENINGKFVVNDRYIFNWQAPSGESKTLFPLKTSLNDYVLNFKKKCEEEGKKISIHIGCDSQSYMNYTRFVFCICLKVEGNGVHVLVSKMDMCKIYDYRFRLLMETDISAEFVRNHQDFFKKINLPLEVHADYNIMTNFKSNGVVTEATNFIKTYGVNLIIKNPGHNTSFAASYAADHFC